MVKLEDIRNAAQAIQGMILRTPLIYSPTISKISGCEVYLKLENLQRGGSFKIRGAAYKVRSHLNEARKGVVAASIGNHAQGVALASKAADVPATIVMPLWASITKQEATKEYGAELILKGHSLTEAIEFARMMAKQSGRLFIHPYDDPEIIAGQGTIGLEIIEDLPDADVIIVPVGGGGLIGGIATAVKALHSETSIVGVQASACPSAYEALNSGMPVLVDGVEEKGSIADAIMVPQVGASDFPLLRDLVDNIAVVTEDQIAAAILLLLERKKILAEGAGAVSLAALLSSSLKIPKGSKVVLVISGGNIDSLLLDRVIHQGLLHHGRLMQFSVALEDVPGSLAKLLEMVAELQANVVNIHHARNERDLTINFTRVDLELETRGFEHIKEIAAALDNAGYRILARPIINEP
ncbi:MAG: threonine ammonia-lyase [Methanotrichaceae archaeon]